MSEKINLTEITGGKERNENLSWAMIEMMCAKGGSELTPWKEHMKDNEDHIFDVEMKIDGVEVQFSTVIKMMFEQYEKQIEREAIKLMNVRFSDVSHHMNEFLESLKYKTEKNWSEE